MTEDLKVKEEKVQQDYTDVTTLHDKSEGEKKWLQIAEVRMLLYVIPVAIIVLILSYIFSH